MFGFKRRCASLVTNNIIMFFSEFTWRAFSNCVLSFGRHPPKPRALGGDIQKLELSFTAYPILRSQNFFHDVNLNIAHYLITMSDLHPNRHYKTNLGHKKKQLLSQCGATEWSGCHRDVLPIISCTLMSGWTTHTGGMISEQRACMPPLVHKNVLRGEGGLYC